MIDINEHQKWLTEFYASRGWLELSASRRLNFLIEEVGELSQGIRAYEIGRDHPGELEKTVAEKKDNVVEELADVMDAVLILCDKFDIAPELLFSKSEDKLNARYDQ